MSRYWSMSRVRGFTLVEILATLLILSLLAGLALPQIKKTVTEQKSAQTVRQVKAFFEEARDRAIATESYVGVIIDRRGIGSDFARSSSRQMRLSNGMQPYSGESEQSVALLFHDIDFNNINSPNPPVLTSPGIINGARFEPVDNPLLDISARSNGIGNVPIRVGDRLELMGGRSVRITSMRVFAPPMPLGSPPTDIIVNFDPRELLATRNSYTATRTLETYAFPGFPKLSNGVPTTTRFRIHRSPTASSVGSLELMRGQTIDLNYSGIGPDGVQFSPFLIEPTKAVDNMADHDFQPIIILFAPDGSVASVSYGLDVGSAAGIFAYDEVPRGNIYFCVGDTDGVRPDDLFDNGKEKANIMRQDANWVVIAPASGRVYASPSATVTPPNVAQQDVQTALGQAVLQSRQLAFKFDTLDDI